MPVRRLIQRVREGKLLLLLVVTASVVLTAVATMFVEPLYESEATILLNEESQDLNLVGGLAALSGLGAISGVTAGGTGQTEVAVLRSRLLVEMLTDSLSLHVRVEEPRLRRSEVLREVAAPRDARPFRLELTRGPDGTYRVSSLTPALESSLAPSIALGSPVTVGDVSFTLNPGLDRSPPETIHLVVDPFDEAVADIRERLQVVQPDQLVNVLVVNFRAGDPEIAAQVPNALTRTYVDYRAQSERASARSYAEFLREQSQSYEVQLLEAEARLQAFQETTRTVFPEIQAESEVGTFSQLEVDEDLLQRRRDALLAVIQAAEAEAARTGSTRPYRALASSPTLLQDPRAQELISTLMSLDNERGALLQRRTDQNVDVQYLGERIGGLELQLRELAVDQINSMEVQLREMGQALARFGSNIERLPANQVEFLRLNREQRFLEQIFLLIQTKLKEAEMEQQSAQIEPAQALDVALVPTAPVAPRPLINLAIAGVAGLMLGLGIILFQGYTDTRVQSRETVEALAASTPILGLIPNGDVSRGRSVGGGGWRTRRLGAGDAQLAQTLPAVWAGAGDPRTEAFRALRTNVALVTSRPSPQVIVVTSPSIGEGKTTTAANLAAALTHQGMRTLVVDADLRKGQLHRVLGVEPRPGLTDVLLGGAVLEQSIQTIRIGGLGTSLDVLTAGSPNHNAAELLASAPMRELIGEMRGRYDRIVFDTPPFNHVTDASALGLAADAILLAVRLGVTETTDLELSLLDLRQMELPLRGLVLTGVPESEVRYGYS